MTRKGWILLTIVALIIGACYPYNQNTFQYRLKKAVNAAFLKGDQALLSLKEVTPFDWDKVYLYGPYRPISKINDQHNTKLEGEFGSVPEGQGLYVFEKDKKTINTFFVSRKNGPFSEQLDPNGYAPEKTIFKVEVRAGGPILVWPSSNQKKSPDLKPVR